MKKVDDKELRLTILACFRYSLGRMTYMPSHTAKMIKNYSDIFTNYDWKQLIKEIDDCDNLRMDCDKQTWQGLKEFALKQLLKQKINHSQSSEGGEREG